MIFTTKLFHSNVVDSKLMHQHFEIVTGFAEKFIV